MAFYDKNKEILSSSASLFHWNNCEQPYSERSVTLEGIECKRAVFVIKINCADQVRDDRASRISEFKTKQVSAEMPSDAKISHTAGENKRGKKSPAVSTHNKNADAALFNFTSRLLLLAKSQMRRPIKKQKSHSLTIAFCCCCARGGGTF